MFFAQDDKMIHTLAPKRSHHLSEKQTGKGSPQEPPFPVFKFHTVSILHGLKPHPIDEARALHRRYLLTTTDALPIASPNANASCWPD